MRKELLTSLLLLTLTSCSTSTQSTAESYKESIEANTPLKVTFMTDDNTIYKSVDVMKGDTIDKPEDPIKQGYFFDGWYVDGEEWSFVGYVVSKNTILTAKWESMKSERYVDLITAAISTPDTADDYTYDQCIYDLGEPSFYSITSIYGNESGVATWYVNCDTLADYNYIFENGGTVSGIIIKVDDGKVIEAYYDTVTVPKKEDPTSEEISYQEEVSY